MQIIMKTKFLTIICLVLLLTGQGAEAGWMGTITAVTGSIIGVGVATVALPAALGVAGFTSAGITAGSYAAGMMSSAAVASGGGVAAGSAVAVCQSIAAAGVSSATTAAAGAVGATAAAIAQAVRP